MATKTAYPNKPATSPAKGQSAPKTAYPNKPATKTVPQGGKTNYPNTGSGPKEPGKVTAPAPSHKGNGPSNIVGGVLGKLRGR